MVKHKGEKLIAAKLLAHKIHDKNNNSFQMLHDMIYCYKKLKVCEFDFTKSYSLDELHLFLAVSVSMQETENRVLNYWPYELSLEAADGDYSISLAKDTYELISVGAKMRICVGSYSDRVGYGKSIIMILRHAKDCTTVGCVELHKDTVVQAKGAHNKLLRDGEWEFVMCWVSDKGLTIRTKDLHKPIETRNSRRIV